MRKKWTDEELERLAELYSERKSNKEIGEILGRSEKSIAGALQMYREKLELDFRVEDNMAVQRAKNAKKRYEEINARFELKARALGLRK
jgi:DNA-binding NarL/FixJ family response regulator